MPGAPRLRVTMTMTSGGRPTCSAPSLTCPPLTYAHTKPGRAVGRSLKWPALPVSRSCRFLVCLGRVRQLLDSACSCRRQLECLSGQPHALPGASAVLRGPVLSAPWLVLTAQPPSTPFIPVPSAQHRSGPPAARSPLLVPSCPAPGTASISRMAVFN